MNRRAHLWITGRVQGVGFRANTAREAVGRGLRGWVRNLDDGRVEAAFEGPADAVEAMVGWCETGPRGARVEGIDREDEAPTGEQGFVVRH